jgi:glutamine synthetase
MVEKREHATYEQVMAVIKNEHVQFVRLDFTDVVGIAKSVVIPVDQFPHCVRHGHWFDGSALENIARVVESDMYLYPDLATFTVLPGQRDGDENVLARVICDIRMPDGERFDGDPRAALSRAIEMAQEMGFVYEVAPEL